MDEKIIHQIVDELLSSLEPLETQSAALLEFLKAKGLATDEDLAPFLEQAGNAANVRWRAMRVRTAALISNAMRPAEPPAETTPASNAQQDRPPADAGKKKESQPNASKKTEVPKKEEKPEQKEESKKESESTPQAAEKPEASSPEKSNSQVSEDKKQEHETGPIESKEDKKKAA